MLKNLKKNEVYVTKPTTVNVVGGVKIHVNEYNEVVIEGNSSLKFKTEGDIEFDAKNISLNAQENVYIGSGKHLVQQAPRIDLNPEYDASGYKK